MLRLGVFFLLFLASIFSKELFAQSQSQIGLQAGVGYYLGDLNETKQFQRGHTHFAWGVVFRVPFNDRLVLKNSYINGTVSGNDADSESSIKQNRNLSFETKINEFTSQLEFNFFRYHPFVLDHYISPYMFVGMGLFWMNPTTTLNGNEYTLRDYRTENQTQPYNKAQFVLPFGVGLKFKFSHRILFGLEYGLRRTFTDYIDDVSTAYPDDPTTMSTVSQALSNRSLDNGNEQNNWGMQRGNSQRNDLYSFTTFTMLIRLGKNPNLCKYNTQ